MLIDGILLVLDNNLRVLLASQLLLESLFTTTDAATIKAKQNFTQSQACNRRLVLRRW